MNTFVKAAKRPVQSIDAFLKGAADNTIKYKPESGKKHWVYFPTTPVQDENGNVSESIVALNAKVHELRPEVDKYAACICLDGIELTDENGNVVNDGTCPYCERVSDSFDIYRYKMEEAEKKALSRGIAGEELDEYKKNSSRKFMGETPVSKGKPYIYLLIVQFKLNSADKPEIGPDGLPVFELKVMKLSDKGITKIQETFKNSNVDLEGSEAIFKYQNQDTPMLVAGSRTVSPVFKGCLMDTYPGLKEAVQAAVDKWNWEGLETAFPEWKGRSTAAAKSECDKIFASWDAYKEDNSRGFLTDGTEKVNNPALPDAGATATPANIGNAGAAPQAQAPNMPTGANMGVPGANAGFGFGAIDPNAAFGGHQL